jgi:predicted nucleotidyltransferase
VSAVNTDPRAELAASMEREHRAEVPREAHALGEEIRRRHGEAVAAVLFYGSCLRRAYVEGGVLDFYVVVDSYRAAYRSTLLSVSNALLPPNVYYVDLPFEGGALRMKYNVISQADFSAACRPESLHPIVWARFCQPAAVLFARDEATRAVLAGDAAECAVTMVSRMLALHPEVRTTEELWQAGFGTTYTTEMRVETPETIRTVFEADPDRYARVTALAVEVLARRGIVQGRVDGHHLQVRMTDAARQAIVRSWNRKLPLAKGFYVIRLIKSALTFGDWLPYALWKLNRHSGVTIDLSERQRRHPLIFGWPVILQLIRGKTLR